MLGAIVLAQPFLWGPDHNGAGIPAPGKGDLDGNP